MQCKIESNTEYIFLKLFLRPRENTQFAMTAFFSTNLDLESHPCCIYCGQKYSSHVKSSLLVPPRFLNVGITQCKDESIDYEKRIGNFDVKTKIFLPLYDAEHQKFDSIEYILLSMIVFKGSRNECSVSMTIDGQNVMKTKGAFKIVVEETPNDEVVCELLYIRSGSVNMRKRKEHTAASTTIARVGPDFNVNEATNDAKKQKFVINDKTTNSFDDTSTSLHKGSVASALFYAWLQTAASEIQEIPSCEEGQCMGCDLILPSTEYGQTHDNRRIKRFHNWISVQAIVQHDPKFHEHSIGIMNTLHKRFKSKTVKCKIDFSRITSRFHYKLIFETKCNHCDFSQKHSRGSLQLITARHSSVTKMLKSYFNSFTIIPKCPTGDEECRMYRFTYFQNPPDYLCIYIPVMQKGKIEEIDIDLQLSFNEITPGYHKDVIYEFHSLMSRKRNENDEQQFYVVRPRGQKYLYRCGNLQETQNILPKRFPYETIVFYELVQLNRKVIATLNGKLMNNEPTINRYGAIKEQVVIGTDNENVKQQVNELVKNYSDIFYLKGEKLSACEVLEHNPVVFRFISGEHTTLHKAVQVREG